MKNRLLVFSIIFLSFELKSADFFHLKILHVSFHQGCINDFKEVADELGLDLTSWFILSGEYSKSYFDGVTSGNAQYNIGHERAERVWNKHKDYFNSFDAIITSDTAALSRIFLQNGFKKPLIIWVCNRFDYFDQASLDCNFPDHEYYQLFADAKKHSNVKIISYTPYEYFYAAQKGVDIGTLTIKPIGILKDNFLVTSAIPSYINKSETLFIPPRLDDDQKKFLVEQCMLNNIPVYCGNYNGPADLKDFKAILHFPYQWSNLALFENIQNGMIHFAPSLLFVKQLLNERRSIRYISSNFAEWAEWYRDENKDLFVYFDSWQDLKEKIERTDYKTMNEKIKNFALDHRSSMLARWRSVFSELIQ